ncbi:GNAT family N-acetyltransferase (plasmid) [Pseudoalteromonas sp. T1lg65]|uniref:GNAT family N-acetyltransferase n=1 Tax=Pseudoalteromonas sp. T1lg65 TaxID=2077101 RepID=UPI003F79272A
MHLTTPRLTLRALQESDWPQWLKLHTAVEVMRYVEDVGEERVIREKFTSRFHPKDKQENQWLTLAIVENSAQQVIGFHGFLSMWTPYQQAELGFVLDPQFQGQGYAFEASQAVIDYAFNVCGYHKLIATVTQGNTPSHNLLKKLGFELEGVLKDNYQLGGNWVNDEKFALFNTNE